MDWVKDEYPVDRQIHGRGDDPRRQRLQEAGGGFLQKRDRCLVTLPN